MVVFPSFMYVWCTLIFADKMLSNNSSKTNIDSENINGNLSEISLFKLLK